MNGQVAFCGEVVTLGVSCLRSKFKCSAALVRHHFKSNWANVFISVAILTEQNAASGISITAVMNISINISIKPFSCTGNCVVNYLLKNQGRQKKWTNKTNQEIGREEFEINHIDC